MRVLLVNSNRFKQPWPVMPFGLGCVTAATERAGHTVELLDLCFSSNPGADIRRALQSFDPEVVGVGIRNIDNSTGVNMQFLLEDVKRDVIDPLREAFQGPIVIGGPAVGVNGAEMLGYFGLELAIRGDGEAAMVELLRRLEADEALDGMPGLTRRANGLTVEDNPPMPVPDMNALAMDSVYDRLNLTEYKKYDSPIQVQTKRGCPLTCSYCTYNRIEGRRWRLRDPQKVADDLERLVRKTGIRHVEFTDSTFNFPLDHCKAVLRAVAAKGLNVRIRTMGLNPGAVDEELVELMFQAGFREVDLGAETLCDATLRGLGKNYRTADVLRAAELLSARGIAIMWYLLMGGPGETEETAKETLATVNRAANPWDLINIGIGLRVYKGAPVADRIAEANPEQASNGFFRPFAYEPDGWSVAQLKTLIKRDALKRTNVCMYDEDEDMPLPILRLAVWLIRKFAPEQPIWRTFIAMRRAQEALGIAAMKRMIFNWKHRSASTESGAPERATALPRRPAAVEAPAGS